MQYFRNYELANAYHVSQATVGKWVEAAKQGKLDLTLHEHNGKSYIANTAKNVAAVEQLVEDRRKYRNTRGFKTITPRPEFYELYNQGQIYDIVLNLERYHEIPREYNYFDGGADNWDKYAQRLATEETPNLLNRTMMLLSESWSYIEDNLGDFKKVNVVDLGVGNALPVKDLLRSLIDKGKLGRYIALDISDSMLKIAARNIDDWFGQEIEFEGYELDLTRDRFANILAEEYTGSDAGSTINLVLFLGGTLNNFRDPSMALKVINDSLGVNDLLIHSQKLDTESSRRYFDFYAKDSINSALAPNHRFIFDLLNVDESFYDVDMGFSEETRQRFIRVQLKVALAIEFDFEGGHRVVELNKGDTVLLWRHWQDKAGEVLALLEETGFSWLHATQSTDQEYLLTISCGKGH